MCPSETRQWIALALQLGNWFCAHRVNERCRGQYFSSGNQNVRMSTTIPGIEVNVKGFVSLAVDTAYTYYPAWTGYTNGRYYAPF